MQGSASSWGGHELRSWSTPVLDWHMVRRTVCVVMIPLTCACLCNSVLAHLNFIPETVTATSRVTYRSWGSQNNLPASNWWVVWLFNIPVDSWMTVCDRKTVTARALNKPISFIPPQLWGIVGGPGNSWVLTITLFKQTTFQKIFLGAHVVPMHCMYFPESWQSVWVAELVLGRPKADLYGSVFFLAHPTAFKNAVHQKRGTIGLKQDHVNIFVFQSLPVPSSTWEMGSG